MKPNQKFYALTDGNGNFSCGFVNGYVLTTESNKGKSPKLWGRLTHLKAHLMLAKARANYITDVEYAEQLFDYISRYNQVVEYSLTSTDTFQIVI